MPENIFQIKTEVFEGPLDLLLNLIEKRKLFINDIALSKVADDYIAYLQNQEKFPIAQSADFLVIASTLLLINSGVKLRLKNSRSNSVLTRPSGTSCLAQRGQRKVHLLDISI